MEQFSFTTCIRRLIFIAVLPCICNVVAAQVRLPKIISDGMVLQRDAAIKVWGWASANEKIKISFLNKAYTTKAGANGNWMIQLPKLKPGGPYTMRIDASNHLVISNILIGDVWVCSGQSNMVHQMKLHAERYATEIETANNPSIRQFAVSAASSLVGPKEDLPSGGWKSADAKNIPDFSAVAYFFARKIYAKYNVPIGLINASVGGTPVEAWTSEKGLEEFPAMLDIIRQNKDTIYINNRLQAAAAASKATERLVPPDLGLTGNKKWFDTNYSPAGWCTMNIPGYWEDQGMRNLDGVAWYRKEIDVPQAMIGIPAKAALGRIVDADILYVNGELAGSTGYQYPQRRYQLPAGMLRAGKNTFVIRVVNNNGKGGFVPGKPYYLAAGNDTIDLKGYWQYKVGSVFLPGIATNTGISLYNQPTALYNAMIAPLTDYTIKGFCWYQGESNAERAKEYRKLLPSLIADWRNQWKQGDLPFLYVQLPGFMDVDYLPGESNWAMLREAQLKASEIRHTGMVVALDLGEWNDIHPDNKKDVGERLALAAENIAYHDSTVVYSGPVYRSSSIEGNKVLVSFTSTGGGLISADGGALQQFSIAGVDKKFVWATAKITGDKVVVWNDTIPAPVYVRYAWADNPANANLYNKERLPASPFRTDTD